MLLINLIYRKYGVPLHNFFFENWTRGISHLKDLEKGIGDYSHIDTVLLDFPNAFAKVQHK